MAKFLLSSLIILTLLAAIFSQDSLRDDNRRVIEKFRRADSLYRKAETLNQLPELSDAGLHQQEDWNKQALTLFQETAALLEKNHLDSFAFTAYRNAALLNDYFDSTTIAKQYYLKALSLTQKLKNENDSSLFKPYLFAGRISYVQNNFDSAILLLKQAEKIQSHYVIPLMESRRVNNLLGVIYYELGNYRQARNYFEKAISVLGTGGAINKDLFVNYKINIGSLLVKLEEYQEADNIYQGILSYGLNNNEIFHNIGIIQQKLGNPDKAISFFSKVHYDKNKRSIDLYYNLALAYADLHDSNKSNSNILKALDENTRWNGSTKNVTLGLIYKFQATQLEQKEQYEQAIALYQSAILQFNSNFIAKAPDENPHGYSGAFSYINLFNTLVFKAGAYQKLYRLKKDSSLLQNSLDAYESAFELADYVEKTYDSDEARLFIGKIKRLAGDAPIDICLQLFKLTNQESYLEKAYIFDQRNKASVLSLNIRDNKLRTGEKGQDSLFTQQSLLRQTITRLSLKAAQTNDSASLAGINNAIRDNEILLGKIAGEIYATPQYASKRVTEHIPSIKDLKQLLDKQTLLLSYHLSPAKIVITIASKDSFDCLAIPLPGYFKSSLDSFRQALNQQAAGTRYTSTKLSNNLYQVLIKPIEERMHGKTRLFIIAEDELNYLPFEALQDDANKYLVERSSITYQYAASLIERTGSMENATSTIAFAPFADKGFASRTGAALSSLPASKYEVDEGDGKVLLDKEATKKYFLDNANHYGTLHLATHAIINDTDSRKSYIAFYPDSTNNDDYKLSAPEIYDLNLDSTNLIILSACETGSGKLIKGEGVMSLSRGFAYAGCPNIITSLWKAEDETTAFIVTHLRQYLEKGDRKDIALQKAKMDLLKDEKTAPQFKTPNYWAHLILIGQFEPMKRSSQNWVWIFGASLIILNLILFILKRRMTKSKA